MGDTDQQVQFRRHLADMRKAASGLGRDFAREFADLDQKIERFGSLAARDAHDLAADIQGEFANLGHAMDDEIRRLPHQIAGAGHALGSGTVRVAGAAKDAVLEAGHRARVGTRNALASAAGVRKTPLRTWSAPEKDEGSSDGDREGDEPSG